MRAGWKIAAFVIALWLVSSSSGGAQVVTLRRIGPELQVHVHVAISGDVSIGAWSSNSERDLSPLLPRILPQALHCPGPVRFDGVGSNTIHCTALHRDGLTLEARIDLAPIARNLDPSTGIQLWLDYPRLGWEFSSIAMTEEEGGSARSSRSIRFDPGFLPPPIRIRFGYQPDQLTSIYVPLLALSLALVLIAFLISRAGLAPLSRSAVLLGTIVWMGLAAQLQADAPLRILLFGNPLASIAALSLGFWPPLLCIALGIALGTKLRPGQTRAGKASEILGSLAAIPLLLTCAVGAFLSITDEGYAHAILWVAIAPAILLVRRALIRGSARSTVRHITAGELKERVLALAGRAGSPKVKLYISFSTRSEIANAFALPGRSIFLTAPLVRSISKREVDAVAAHELSHLRHSQRGLWTALCLAMVLCQTPATDLLLFWPGGLLTAMLLPIAIFFVSLRGLRKREFAADAGAAALTGDARAMISSLAKIERNNGPLPLNRFAEWFSSHPATPRRIRALAMAARLDPSEVERLSTTDDPGDRYELPEEQTTTAVFTLAWQKTNAAIYAWVVVFASCASGLLAGCLLTRFSAIAFGGYGILQAIGAIALGCILTKALASGWMSANYSRLRRKLEARLSIRGQLVGLAIDSEPRIYNGFRFSDAGLLRFDNGMLCYRSERITIALNPADVVEVTMVSASPSNWFRLQPMIRFRQPETGALQSLLLHPVDWLPTQQQLLGSIEKWRNTQRSSESTTLIGFDPVAGQPFVNLTIAAAVRAFTAPGCLTLLAAIWLRFSLHTGWSFVGWAVAVTACSYLFLLLPAMVYRRPPAISPAIRATLDAN